MDNFSWDVIIRLATQGAKGSAAELTQVGNAVDNLNRQGKLTEKSVDSLSKGIVQAGRSASNATPQNQKYAQSLNSIRYANYDVARSMFTVSAAITAAGVGVAAAFASQESAFTSVERIVSGSSEQIGELRDQLQELSTEIPRSFQDLSAIASLGAALDIPAASLERFTEIVAKFAATTGTTEEAAASGFGRLAAYFNLDESQFEAVGSAILKAGNVSVATEEQVLKFSEALSLAGSRAGFTADQTVGLAAGIASFGKINVEGAGSALSRITAQISLATAEGGEKLENFALVAGMSADEFRKAWSADSFGTFDTILRNLSGVENANLVLKELGVNNERDSRTILALSQNYQKYNSIVQQTSEAYREGTYLNQAYAKVLDDLNSQWQIFVNAVTNAAAAVGAEFAPALKELLAVSTEVLKNLAAFAKSETGQFFIKQVAIIATLVAGYAALRGGIALASGAFLALRSASAFIGPGILNAVRGLAVAMGIMSKNTQTGAVSFVNFGRALRGAGIIGLVLLITNLLTDLGGTVQWVGNTLRDFARGIQDFVNSVGILDGIGGANQNVVADWGQSIADWGKTLPGASNYTVDFADAVNGAAGGMSDFGDEALNGAGDLSQLGDSADDAAQKVRTLVDYANDLSSVWTRAFDIRFSSQSTLDAITKTFQDMRDAAAESERSIQSLKSQLQGLQSDLGIQQYFLGIATNYGDTKRAEAIQAKIAELQSQIADKTADLNKEQASNSKELKGNTSAAIANRETLRGLVQQYQSHVQALAASGLTQDQLAIATEQLRQDFIAQATQLGFNRAELGLYEQSFNDVSVAIANVPRDITVTANVDPALQALNEFVAQAAAQAANAGDSAGSAFGTAFGDQVKQSALEAAGEVRAQLLSRFIEPAWRSRMTGGGSGRSGWREGGGGSFADGGYTGSGSRLQPAGIVHRGEYVVPRHQVNQRTGLPYADALGRLQRGARGRTSYAGGGYVQGGVPSGRMVVDLSSMSIQQIGMVMDKVISVGGEVIGNTASKQYAHQTALGAF